MNALDKPHLIEQGFVVNETLPSDYAGVQLVGGRVMHAIGPGGNLLLQQLNYPLFSIRYKTIQLSRPLRLHCNEGEHVLIALLALKNTIKCTTEGIGSWYLRPGEFLLMNAGEELLSAQLDEAEDNQIIEIGYSTEILNSFSPFFPFLTDELSASPPFLINKHFRAAGPKAIEIIHDLLQAPVEATVQSLYFEFKVREYLLLLLSATSQEPEEKQDLTAEQSARLAGIATRLRTETSKKYPINQLAREMQMNEMKLKTVFKAVYGKGIHAYQLDARMHEAHQLLEKGELTTKAIAAKVGYELTTSFITKFREYFGYPPSQVTKHT